MLLVALFIGTTGSRGPRTNTDHIDTIASEFKCPTCRSESVETSNTQTARIVRADIARRVEQGQTDDQIRAYLISRYGQDLLLTPASTGASSLVWILPIRTRSCARSQVSLSRSGDGMLRVRARSATRTGGSSTQR